jgi:MFS family permease
MTTLQRARLATSAVFFANGFCIGGWSASLAPLKALFALSDGRLSLILLAFAAGAVVFMPIGGAVAPRLGASGTVTARSGLGFCASVALPSLCGNATELAAAAFVMGAGMGIMDVSMNAHASAVERRWRSPIMSSFHAAFSIGGFVGAAFGAAVLGLALGPRALLAAVAVIAAAIVAFSAFHVGEGDRPEGASAPLGWPERAFVGIAAVAFLCFMVEGAMVDWSGVYLASRGVSASAASFGFAAFSTTMVLGRLFGDRVVARLGRLVVVGAGAALAALGLALAALVPQLPTIALGFALVGAGLSNVVPALFSQSASLASSPARGIAAIATTGYAGFLAGPPIIGAIAAVSDLRVGVAALAVAATAAALITMTLGRVTRSGVG